MTYTEILRARKLLDEGVAIAIDEMIDIKSIEEKIEKAFSTTVLKKIKMKRQNPKLETIHAKDTHVSEKVFKEFLELTFQNDDNMRKIGWRYRDLEMKQTALSIIINSNPREIVIKTLKSILKKIIIVGKENATLFQLIEKVKVNASFYERDGEKFPLSQNGLYRTKLTVIGELAEADVLNIRKKGDINFVSFRDEVTNKIPKEFWGELKRLSRIANLNTVLTEPKQLDTTGIMSISSWFYEPPKFSEDLVEFISIMHRVRWEFIPDAEGKIEGAYKAHKHPDGEKFEEHEIRRLQELKEQIKLSRTNKGHYCSGRFDGSLRWYWEQEFGHNQTSKSLRKLVKIVGIKDPVKYDAPNSMVQMFALGMRDKQLAAYVKLVKNEECVEDVRQTAASVYNKFLNIETFTKSNIKSIFMPWGYNAGRERLLNGSVKEETNVLYRTFKTIKKPGIREIAQRGGSRHSDDELWGAWLGVMNKLVPSIVALKKYFGQIVEGNPFHLATWTLPDGGIAQYASVKLMQTKLKWTSSEGKNLNHVHKYKLLSYEEGNAGLLPRITHSIDAYIMRQIVIRAYRLGIIVVPNHDSFIFSREYYDTVLDIVRNVYIEVMENRVLGDIITQINKNRIKPKMKFPEITQLKPEDIMESEVLKLEED